MTDHISTLPTSLPIPRLAAAAAARPPPTRHSSARSNACLAVGLALRPAPSASRGRAAGLKLDPAVRESTCQAAWNRGPGAWHRHRTRATNQRGWKTFLGTRTQGGCRSRCSCSPLAGARQRGPAGLRGRSHAKAPAATPRDRLVRRDRRCGRESAADPDPACVLPGARLAAAQGAVSLGGSQGRGRGVGEGPSTPSATGPRAVPAGLP